MPCPRGRSPISDPLPLGHAAGDELDQVLTLGGQDAEGAVLRVDQGARGLDDPAEHLRQLEVGADGDDRVQQRAQPLLGPTRR